MMRPFGSPARRTVAALLAGAALAVPALAFAQPSSTGAQHQTPPIVIRGLDQIVIEIKGQEIARQVVRELEQVARDPRTRQAMDQVRDLVNDSVRGALTGLGPVLDRAAREAPGGADVQDRNYRSELTDRETRTLALGANGSLELKNIAGDITVSAGTGRDAVVEILRRSRARTDADAKLGLDRVKVQVDQRADRAIVSAEYPNGQQPFSVSVSYTVTVPPGTRLNVNSISGNTVIRNVKGEVGVQVTSGSVTLSGARQVSHVNTISGDITVSDFDGDGTVVTGAISGNISLERVKARRIEVDVTSGDIKAHDVSCDGAVLKSLSGLVEYAGALAKSGRYELQTFSGSVRFVPMGNTGFDLHATTFSGDITVDRGIDLKSVQNSRRSLRGTFGDGGASVIATAFSGDVAVVKR